MLSSIAQPYEYAGNGTTVNFSLPYKCLDQSHVKVALKASGSDVWTLLTLGTHYTVSGVGNDSGVTVVMITAPASGETLRVERFVTNDQVYQYSEGDDFPAEQHENALDRIVMQIQQIASRVGLSSFTLGILKVMGISSSDSDAWDGESHKIINVDDAEASTDVPNLGQVQGLINTSGALSPPTTPGQDDYLLVADTGAWTPKSPSDSRTALGLAGISTLANPTTPGQDNYAIIANAGSWTATAPSAARTALGLSDLATTSNAYLRGWIDGLTASNNATDADHDIDFADGVCADSTFAYLLRTTSTMVKQIDAAWAAGTNQGGLFSGTVASNTRYFLFIIRKDSDGSIDFGFDTTKTGANVPSGYTYFRRIGYVQTDGSANIRAFKQYGNWFYWTTPINDVTATNPGTSAVNFNPSLPPIDGVIGYMSVNLDTAGTATDVGCLLSNPDITDTAPTINVNHVCVDSGHDNATGVILFPTSSGANQYRYRLSASNASIDIRIDTVGWYDPRGAN